MTAGTKAQGRWVLAWVSLGLITGAGCHLTCPQDLGTGEHCSAAPLPSPNAGTTAEALF